MSSSIDDVECPKCGGNARMSCDTKTNDNHTYCTETDCDYDSDIDDDEEPDDGVDTITIICEKTHSRSDWQKFKRFYKPENKGDKINFSVRGDLYDRSLTFFLMLFREAQKDFPHLTSEDIDCVEYGGDRIKGTRGIEFSMPVGTKIPKGYTDGIYMDPYIG